MKKEQKAKMLKQYKSLREVYSNQIKIYTIALEEMEKNIKKLEGEKNGNIFI